MTKLGSWERRVDGRGVLQKPHTRGFDFGRISLGLQALQCFDKQIAEHTRFVSDCKSVSMDGVDAAVEGIDTGQGHLTYVAYDGQGKSSNVEVGTVEARDAWCALHAKEKSFMKPLNFYRCRLKKWSDPPQCERNPEEICPHWEGQEQPLRETLKRAQLAAKAKA